LNFLTKRGSTSMLTICVSPSSVSGSAAVMPTERPKSDSPLSRIIIAA
jgi:hypothetical protein